MAGREWQLRRDDSVDGSARAYQRATAHIRHVHLAHNGDGTMLGTRCWSYSSYSRPRDASRLAAERICSLAMVAKTLTRCTLFVRSQSALTPAALFGGGQILNWLRRCELQRESERSETVRGERMRVRRDQVVQSGSGRELRAAS